MIRSRRLVVTDESADALDELAAALARGVQGEVRFDAGSRAVYAHDASNYRQVPIGVVAPRDAGDVAHVLRTCRARRVPVLGRGGGTSLAGQCVNRAIVMDFSKYMNRVLEVDVERRRVRVQPGCILDDMIAAIEPHGLAWGPDPATHNHCTLGGMLGNNSCGIHSVMGELYGPGARTSDHVVELTVMTYDGIRLRVGATPDDELERLTRTPGRIGEIYRGLRALRDRYADLIRPRFAPIPRRVSGYNLDELLPEHQFHVARALVGSESTCVTILDATLEVYPARPRRRVVVLGYPDVFAAGDAVARVREHRPVGLEGMDSALVRKIRHTGLHIDAASLLPEGDGWLFVELGADSDDDVDEQARHLVEAMRGSQDAPSVRMYEKPEEIEQLWRIRESGLGATAFPPGEPATWPGWEDSAVPPARVGEYLRDLHRLFDAYGYDGALYGHFGQGCIHTRITFDLDSPDGIARFKHFTDDAADLVARYGGSISGEHGDGQARADLLAKQYGEELVGAFREFKHVWDPDGCMNPGKIVDANHRDENLFLASYHPREVATAFHPPEDAGDFRHSPLRCVGVGECRRMKGGTMCPSFKVTREELHTTRGRAHILFEMLHGGVIDDGWASEAVKDSLDLCLSCKGCKSDCPVNVDIATYKAEFLSHYYRHHRRPRHAYAFGWIHRWAWLASHVPWLANAVTQTSGLRRLAAWLGGMTPERAIPRFARTPFTRSHRPRCSDAPPVILWPDTFNNHFYPETLESAVTVLEDAGYQVLVPTQRLCCGRGLYDYGMLDLAKRLWRKTLRVLGDHIARGTPIVGLEPSCVSAFRDELPSLLPHDDRARRLASQVKTLPELLIENDYAPPYIHTRALVHGHCHHKAVLDFGAERALLDRMQLDVAAPDSGCCGLAGSFGFEAEHYDISMQIGELSLLPAVREEPGSSLLIADGFSCRQQIEHATDRNAYHVAEVLAAALHELDRVRSPRDVEDDDSGHVHGERDRRVPADAPDRSVDVHQ